MLEYEYFPLLVPTERGERVREEKKRMKTKVLTPNNRI